MRTANLSLLAAVALAAAGCGNLDRSRDLGNPNVSATTLAQQVCSNCHGMTGVAVSPNFPNLASQGEPYFVAQMKGFKSHDRHDPAGFEYMWGLSRSLTDEQIAGLAAYYRRQTPAHQAAESVPGRLEAGKTIFEQGVPERSVPACAGCHGAHGEGMATFPRLAGQHADYVVKQLAVFQRTDDRPEGGIMKTVAHELTQQNIDDVAGYLQALPGLK
jgi:cytochrome c553